jgi:acyl-coenzyme A synthetase/AMP-(fatty) acid ligase
VTLTTRELAGQNDKHELGIEGPHHFLGYCGEILERRRTVWTGDIVELGPDSRYVLHGRVDRAMKAHDTTWLFPERLEKWLRQRGDIRDAVVRPAPAGGEIDCWLDWDGDAAGLTRAIEAELGRTYRPRKIIRSTIVRSALGKIQKIEAAAAEQAARPVVSHHPVPAAI